MNWALVSSDVLTFFTALTVISLFLQYRTINRTLKIQSLQQLSTVILEADKVLMTQPDLIPYVSVDMELPDMLTEFGQRARLMISIYLSALENGYAQIELMTKPHKIDFLKWCEHFVELSAVQQFMLEFPHLHELTKLEDIKRLLSLLGD